ncbi:hypothetical protein [Photobacterium nomapromontoriensis]|uniref:hypothetical protein n=1 Tax=Photobacterium nomapromontoriensis TaxID=2910237 RepID=UPI003D134EF7
MQFSDSFTLIYQESCDDSTIQEFINDLNGNGVSSTTVIQNHKGLINCPELFIPTMIIAGVSAGFLNEAGKELFQLFKAKLGSFTTKTMKRPRIEPVLYGVGGVRKSDNPYSLVFSICAKAKNDREFKLLIPKYNVDTNYNEIVSSYLDFLYYYNEGVISEIDIGLDLSRVQIIGAAFVHFNTDTKNIEWVDYLPKDVRERMTPN